MVIKKIVKEQPLSVDSAYQLIKLGPAADTTDANVLVEYLQKQYKGKSRQDIAEVLRVALKRREDEKQFIKDTKETEKLLADKELFGYKDIMNKVEAIPELKDAKELIANNKKLSQGEKMIKLNEVYYKHWKEKQEKKGT